jgi:L-rhamnose mutarotase
MLYFPAHMSRHFYIHHFPENRVMRKAAAFCIVFLLAFVQVSCQRIEPKPEFLKVTKRTGELNRLRPEFEERYIILHKHTFPGVLDRIYKSNMRNYTIFLRDGVLFAHHEYVGVDPQADAAAIKADVTTQEWWKLTDPMQEPLETRKEGEWWASMDELLFADARVVDYRKAARYAFVAQIAAGNEDQVRHVIAGISAQAVELAERFHVQNLTAYGKDGRIYVYFEYYGENAANDLKALQEDADFAPTRQALSSLMVHPVENRPCWQTMRQVFHAD